MPTCRPLVEVCLSKQETGLGHSWHFYVLMRKQCLQSAITVTCPEGQEVFGMPLELWHTNWQKEQEKSCFKP